MMEKVGLDPGENRSDDLSPVEKDSPGQAAGRTSEPADQSTEGQRVQAEQQTASNDGVSKETRHDSPDPLSEVPVINLMQRGVQPINESDQKGTFTHSVPTTELSRPPVPLTLQSPVNENRMVQLTAAHLTLPAARAMLYNSSSQYQTLPLLSRSVSLWKIRFENYFSSDFFFRLLRSTRTWQKLNCKLMKSVFKIVSRIIIN